MRALAAAAFLPWIVASPCWASLPTIERAEVTGSSPFFCVFLTGDGGWRKIDATIADEFNRHGVPVVGILSDRYFARPVQPDRLASDLTSLIDEYSVRWARSHAIVVGYSRGADAIPLALNRVPAATRRLIAMAVMIGPAHHAQLHIHHFWSAGPDPPSVPLIPEMQKLAGIPLMCVQGSTERDSLCDDLEPTVAVRLVMPGGHHFAGHYRRTAQLILERLAELP